MWAYRNPVNITFGEGSFRNLGALIGDRSYALVTYPDTFFTELGGRLAAMAGPPTLVVGDVAPNPDFSLLARQAARFPGGGAGPQVIVALGGGSVIDSAKVFAAAAGDFQSVRAFLEMDKAPRPPGAVPIIAVPTTAGTGSEVTCWSTVWDAACGVKHSLTLPTLYPEHAVIDPALMLGKPRELTVSTGLDALSHALESLWNKNVNPVSMTFAVSAAREILDVLPRLADDLGNLALRARMARVALFAGLSFSNTKTAIAHSLSYPITLRHGVAHGIACAFTLPMILRSMNGTGGLCGRGLMAIFDGDLEEGAERLTHFLHRLGVPTDPRSHGLAEGELMSLLGSALAGERGRNFIGSQDALRAAMTDAERHMPAQ